MHLRDGAGTEILSLYIPSAIFFSTAFCDAWTSKLSFSIFLTSLPLCFLPPIVMAPSGSTERQVAQRQRESALCGKVHETHLISEDPAHL